MKFSFRKILVFFVLLTSFTRLQSQEMKVISDLRLRSEISIEKELFDDWEVQFEATMKVEENISRIDEFDFDFDIDYDLFKFLTLGIGYRWELNKNNDNIYRHRHRWKGDAELEAERGRYEFAWRIRYQTLDEEAVSFPVTGRRENILRNRFEIKYNVPKIKLFPFVSVEHYGTLNDVNDYGIKIRYMAGVGYDFGKFHDIEVYYRINREINALLPYTFHYIGIGYGFSF